MFCVDKRCRKFLLFRKDQVSKILDITDNFEPNFYARLAEKAPCLNIEPFDSSTLTTKNNQFSKVRITVDQLMSI